jgi:hypothetical protein
LLLGEAAEPVLPKLPRRLRHGCAAAAAS